MRSMSILSLQNEFLGRDSGLRFWIGCSARRTLRIERKTGLNETFEERVRLVRFALKFRVILAADEIRMIPKLNQFRQRAIRRRSGNDEAFFVHTVAIFHVELVTVPVPLHQFGLAVDFFGYLCFRVFCLLLSLYTILACFLVILYLLL